MRNYLWCPNDPRGYGIDDDEMRDFCVFFSLLRERTKAVRFVEVVTADLSTAVTTTELLFQSVKNRVNKMHPSLAFSSWFLRMTVGAFYLWITPLFLFCAFAGVQFSENAPRWRTVDTDIKVPSAENSELLNTFCLVSL